MDEKDAVQSRADESPASLPPPAASLIGSDVRCKAGRAVPKRGRPSSRSATRQSRVAQRASKANPHKGDASQGPGDLTWSRQTSTPARRRREATAREELVTGESKEEANSERRTRAPRRTPCPRSGDAGRGCSTIASGLAHRSAQHLTPLRGRPPAERQRRWRGKEPRSLYRDRRSRRGPVPTGPRTLRCRTFPREGPAANNHVAVDISTRLQTTEGKTLDTDRPLSGRKGTRASEARSQGYAGADARNFTSIPI